MPAAVTTRTRKTTRRKPVTQTVRHKGWQLQVDTPEPCPVFRGKGQSAYIKCGRRHELYFRLGPRKWEWRGTRYTTRRAMIEDITRFWARLAAREETHRTTRTRTRKRTR